MIYVMSDIHGNMRRFNSIMKQINLTENDTLYILGDVIDRYHDGIKILRKIMAMDNVKMLLGNHEYMMLQSIYYNGIGMDSKKLHGNYGILRLWYDNGGYVTHNYLKHIKKSIRAEIFEYLDALPVSINLTVNDKKFKLVHAAPEEMYTDYYSFRYRDIKEFVVWHRLHKHDTIPGDYTLIYGHTPTVNFQDDVPLKIYHRDHGINIDCGAGTAEKPDLFHCFCFGRLACLRLDDMKEFYSEEDYKIEKNEQT